MAENITKISGATEIELYYRNYTYATAYSDLKLLCAVYFTDLDRLGYKGVSGGVAGPLRKLLEDASGATNHAANLILYTDATGRATANSNIAVDGDSLSLLEPLKLGNGWSIETTATRFSIYKDGDPTGFYIE